MIKMIRNWEDIRESENDDALAETIRFYYKKEFLRRLKQPIDPAREKWLEDQAIEYKNRLQLMRRLWNAYRGDND